MIGGWDQKGNCFTQNVSAGVPPNLFPKLFRKTLTKAQASTTALLETDVNDLPGTKQISHSDHLFSPVSARFVSRTFAQSSILACFFHFLSNIIQPPKTLLPHMDCSTLPAQKPFTDGVTS